MRVASTAGECFLENEAFLDLRRVEESPTDRMRWVMKRIAQLKRQESLDAFVDAVVVWLGDAEAVVVANLNQSSVLDREAENRVDRLRGHVPLTLRVACPYARGARMVGRRVDCA